MLDSGGSSNAGDGQEESKGEVLGKLEAFRMRFRQSRLSTKVMPLLDSATSSGTKKHVSDSAEDFVASTLRKAFVTIDEKRLIAEDFVASTLLKAVVTIDEKRYELAAQAFVDEVLYEIAAQVFVDEALSTGTARAISYVTGCKIASQHFMENSIHTGIGLKVFIDKAEAAARAKRALDYERREYQGGSLEDLAHNFVENVLEEAFFLNEHEAASGVDEYYAMYQEHVNSLQPTSDKEEPNPEGVLLEPEPEVPEDENSLETRGFGGTRVIHVAERDAAAVEDTDAPSDEDDSSSADESESEEESEQDHDEILAAYRSQMSTLEALL